MAVPLLTAEQIRQMIPALHRQASGHVILSDVYAIGLAYGVIRVFERRIGGRVVATLGTLATDAAAILATLENLGQVWPDGAAEKPLWKAWMSMVGGLECLPMKRSLTALPRAGCSSKGRQGLINSDFGQQATVLELSAEDRAELARAPGANRRSPPSARPSSLPTPAHVQR